MPKPSAKPTSPPVRLSIDASTTNWSSMSRLLAPIALRIPISLVRSVTDTSMMFIIPMPPTSRLIPAMLPEEQHQNVRRLLQGLYGLLLVADSEVVLVGEAVTQLSRVVISRLALSVLSESTAWRFMVSTLISPGVVRSSESL